MDDDDALEGLWKKEYSLAELVANDQFKSYDELKKRLEYVLGNKAQVRQDPEVVDEDNDRGVAEQAVATASTPTSEEDDTLSYFAQLAE